MIIKYDNKTGNVIHALPESKYNPPGTIGHVQVYENGKKKYKDKDQIRTILLEGPITKEYQDPRNNKTIGSLVIKKHTNDEIRIYDKKSKKTYKGKSVTRFYTEES